MVTINIGAWDLLVEDGPLPLGFDEYLERAEFVDQFDAPDPRSKLLFLGVSDCGMDNWPSMVITQRYEDARGVFRPGILHVPETSCLFIGAGERLLCYNIAQRTRLWTDQTSCGFWSWERLGACVVMSAELEFAVWTTNGRKLWSTFVEPPWNYEIKRDMVKLDVMGVTTWRRLKDGTVRNDKD